MSQKYYEMLGHKILLFGRFSYLFYSPYNRAYGDRQRLVARRGVKLVALHIHPSVVHASGSNPPY